MIELLVVIAIIAVLAAMLLPGLNQARESGRRAVCVGNQRQVHLLLQLYADDFGGWFPPMNQNPNFINASAISDSVVGAIVPNGLGFLSRGKQVTAPFDTPTYASDPAAFFCPSIWPGKDRRTQWNAGSAGYLYLGDCWSISPWTSVQYNGLLRSGSTNIKTPNGFAYGPERLEGLMYNWKPVNAANVILMFDHASIPAAGAPFVAHAPGGPLMGGNVLYTDGHVRWVEVTKWVMFGGTNNRYQPWVSD